MKPVHRVRSLDGMFTGSGETLAKKALEGAPDGSTFCISSWNATHLFVKHEGVIRAATDQEREAYRWKRGLVGS
jgi:hypothetical protein